MLAWGRLQFQWTIRAAAYPAPMDRLSLPPEHSELAKVRAVGKLPGHRGPHLRTRHAARKKRRLVNHYQLQIVRLQRLQYIFRGRATVVASHVLQPGKKIQF